MKWNRLLVLLCKLHIPVFHHQAPNFHQLTLTSSLFAVKMASDTTFSSKSSVIFIVIIMFYVWSFFTFLNKQIEEWPVLRPWHRKEKQGPGGVGPEEGHKDDQRAGTSLLWGKAERVGVFQPSEEKDPGRPDCSLPVLERGLNKRGGDKLFSRTCCNRTKSNGSKLKRG